MISENCRLWASCTLLGMHARWPAESIWYFFIIFYFIEVVEGLLLTTMWNLKSYVWHRLSHWVIFFSSTCVEYQRHISWRGLLLVHLVGHVHIMQMVKRKHVHVRKGIHKFLKHISSEADLIMKNMAMCWPWGSLAHTTNAKKSAQCKLQGNLRDLETTTNLLVCGNEKQRRKQRLLTIMSACTSRNSWDGRLA
jgi:hypothetical protein